MALVEDNSVLTDDHPAPLPPVWRTRLEEIRQTDPRLHGKLVRVLMEHLHRKKVVSIEDLEREARLITDENADASADPNRPSPRGGPRELETLHRLVLDWAERTLSAGEVEAVLHTAHRNELVIELGNAADNPAIPFEAVLNRLSSGPLVPAGRGRAGDARPAGRPGGAHPPAGERAPGVPQHRQALPDRRRSSPTWRAGWSCRGPATAGSAARAPG